MAGRFCLIQGASRGLGLALASRLLDRDAVELVIATSREPEQSPGLDALSARHGRRLARVPLDLQDPASIAAAAERVGAWTGRLHLLINAAGLLHDDRGVAPERRLEAVTQANLRAVFEVNAFGPILVAQAFAGLLTHHEPAVLANVSARVGSVEDNRLGGWYAYRASKAAQNQLTKTLAIEMRRRAKNLTVVAMHPGTVATDLSAPFRRNVAPDKLFTPDEAARRMLAVLGDVGPSDSGRFFAHDGAAIPW